ncbi:leucine-rich repeat protein, putative [Bodo saltans]|uniref:Leucine-rich repeat protein, putative n=1 Tax=Bodo saltans TaxID=75058 RepID=A0A0S4IVB0_BODSA|nr:leucine-rich repeat protein, putative [Bodo saltans]|eukprot:CUF55441.1 leucine-rich repeat protein, putative [Bodo saltans]
MCASLERLTLRSCAAITNASIQHLHHLSRLYHLEIYNSNNCLNLHSSGDDRFLLRMLSSSENTGRVIQSLGLYNHLPGDWQVIQPAAAKGCFSHISSLTLAGCSLGKRGLTTFFRQNGNLNHLQNLSRKCNIDLQKLLVVVKSFKPLRSIDLSDNPVADDSLEHFSDFPVLESINLSHCRLTDRGIERRCLFFAPPVLHRGTEFFLC